MKIYVDSKAAKGGDGTKKLPFTTISQAAKIAQAGDEVLVSPGIYQEEVNPYNGGTIKQPIIYKSTEPLKAVITGATTIKGWERYGDNEGVWFVSVSNSIFGDFNPYTEELYGDWLDSNFDAGHLGEVYLNNQSLYEVGSLEKVINPTLSDASWVPDFSVFTWFTKQDVMMNNTVIYANFHDFDPNKETVEINVRRHCFYPQQEHINYIHLDGFTVTKAATQWAPPTALQDGMIGPHWSKGWVIENCDISHSKCSGISLGKYKQEGNDNKWTRTKIKDGAKTQRACSCIAQTDGWSKDTIGSHTIRNCEIHHCGQTGIVGNLGGVFSVIENNHIHDINIKRNIGGAEVGGIKLHAAIDVIIRHNHIHDCVRGIWLDWQAQGTRVTGNLFYNNCMANDDIISEKNTLGLGLGEDIFIEISLGPTLVDNNILLSDRAVKVPTQGVALVHNLVGGSICAVGRGVNNGSLNYASPRFTPVHSPHSTQIVNFVTILHGDFRAYNNVFVQQKIRPALKAVCDPFKEENEWDDGNLEVGMNIFDGYVKEETWLSYFEGNCAEGSETSRDRYYMPLPVWAGGNVYFNGAKPWNLEDDATEIKDCKISIDLKIESPTKWSINTDYLAKLPTGKTVDSNTLGIAYEPEERFENPDGSDIVFDTDIFGKKRSHKPVAGPIA